MRVSGKITAMESLPVEEQLAAPEMAVLTSVGAGWTWSTLVVQAVG